MSQEGVEIVGKVIAAWNTGGIDAMLSFVPEDVVWYPFPSGLTARRPESDTTPCAT